MFMSNEVQTGQENNNVQENVVMQPSAEDINLVQDIIAMQQQQDPQVEVEADFLFNGKPYTYAEFAQAFKIDDSILMTTVEILKQRGNIRELNPDNRDKLIKKVEKAAIAIEKGKSIINDELAEEHYKLETKREGVPTYDNVEFEFGTKTKLDDFRLAVYDLDLDSEVIINDNGFYVLRVYHITEKELGKLSMLYKTNKVVDTGVRKVQKGTESAVKAANYGVKNIATPVAKAGFGAGARIAKVLATGLFRFGAVATTEIIECTREAAHEIKNDATIAVAKAEIIQAKNDILDKSGRSASGCSGIKINM